MSTTLSPRSRATLSLAALSAALLALTACAGETDPASPAESAAGSASVSASTPAAGSDDAETDSDDAETDSDDAETGTEDGDRAAEAVTVEDAWTRSTQGPMTASFGTLRNDSAADLHVASVSSETYARTELHEMVPDGNGSMVMQEAREGFVIPADGEFELAPGGHHVMFLELEEPILAGEETSYVLEFEDGSTLEVTAPVRDHDAEEGAYAEGEGMDHGAGHGSDDADAETDDSDGGHDR